MRLIGLIWLIFMGGYQSLLVYRLSVTIFDGTIQFCNTFLKVLEFRRTVEQMVQAARSGKQNIVEGSLEVSVESNIKLTGVARASFGELLEDYKDYLRQRNLPIWEKTNPYALKIRSYREDIANLTHLSNLANWSHLDLSNSTHWGNLMICLLYKENYLLDQLLRSLQTKFVHEGGFRENLFRKRREYKNKLGKFD